MPQGMGLQQALGRVRAQGIKLRDCTSFSLWGHVRLRVMPPAAQVALQNAWQCLKKEAS